MRILITNDDGHRAEGLIALAEAFGNEHEVWIVAPDREQSACSHKLTLTRPLRLFSHGLRNYSIDGTPTDCVYMAVHHLMPEKPDLLLSGINCGPNMGDDVTYSGTVAAAMEGTVLEIPSIAVSSAGFTDLRYDGACEVVRHLAERVTTEGLPPGTLLNVNVPPQQTPEKIRMQTTRLGRRNYSQSIIRRNDPRDKPYFWIGGDANGSVKAEGSDITAIEDGSVSVTPLNLDMTDFRALETMKNWKFQS